MEIIFWAVVGGVIGAGLLRIIAAHLRWERYKPKVYHRGIGIIYGEDSVKPWAHWDQCIDACLNVTEQHELLKRHFPALTDFWIEVVAYNKPLTNRHHKTGWVKHGWDSNPPTTEAEAQYVFRIMGAATTVKKYPWSKEQHVIQVVQPREDCDPVDTRLMRGGGPVKPMDRSNFFFTYAQKHVEYVMAKNELLPAGYAMSKHIVRPMFADLESRIEEEFREINRSRKL